ncbi:MAG: Hsp20/alpha crystallin family protein [Candidatus Paceibacterota bacterium]|jgi:HSP20 family protein
MKKKSFFERLTGIVKIDDDYNEIESSNDDSDEETEEMLCETEGQLAIDMFQTPSEIIIKTMVAGTKPDDLDINITRDMVTIKGKREESDSSDDDDFFHKELYWGCFSRTIILPQEIEVEEAEATNKNGLLTIRLPKLDKNRQAKLKVKSS